MSSTCSVSDTSDHAQHDMQDLFSSTGLVRIRVIEIVDALDYITKQPGYNKKVNKLYHVYSSVAMQREKSTLYKYDTKCKPYLSRGSGQMNVGEEFLFHVSSTFLLTLSLYAFLKECSSTNDDRGDIAVPCVGTINVPISRLGDGEECKVILA
jgi:hypothetical protein